MEVRSWWDPAFFSKHLCLINELIYLIASQKSPMRITKDQTPHLASQFGHRGAKIGGAGCNNLELIILAKRDHADMRVVYPGDLSASHWHWNLLRHPLSIGKG
mgnify:CR=1 FL=1